MALTGYERGSLEEYTVAELQDIARSYYITFKTESGNTSTNYSRLNKAQLIHEIKYDADYQKSNPDRRFDDAIFKDENRILSIRRDLIGIENPSELMRAIMKSLSDTEVDFPSVGNYYTYIYSAKTPGLIYDRHPLIMASEPVGNGFMGFNYHWQLRGGQSPFRQYTTPEVRSGYFEMTVSEFNTLRGVNYALFVQNSP